MPYTIIRSTQFFEFVKGIAESAADGDTSRLAPARVQPIAADDVGAAVADIALGEPVNGTVEVAGPDALPLAEMARRLLASDQDSRQVTDDPTARYYGAELDDQALVPGGDARLGPTQDWLAARDARR